VYRGARRQPPAAIASAWAGADSDVRTTEDTKVAGLAAQLKALGL